MANIAPLDIDALLVPIPGDAPAGEAVGFTVRTELDEMRKEVDPADFDANDPTRPTEAKKADWAGIVRRTQKVMLEESKDLLTAARLTEALVKSKGFPGLSEGLGLMRRLLAECWDRLYPSIEDGDLEVRAGPFNWLGDADRGARFPTTVRKVPLVVADGVSCDWQTWKLAQEGRGPVNSAKFEATIDRATREEALVHVRALRQARDEFVALGKVLEEKLAGAAPGLIDLRAAIADCLTLAEQVLQRKGGETVDEPADSAEAAEANGEGRPAGPRAMLTRADVYRQLTQAADLLQQLEPHSPIPYLVRRAVELGAMPFPRLIRELVRDENILTEMSRELGIKEPPPA